MTRRSWTLTSLSLLAVACQALPEDDTTTGPGPKIEIATREILVGPVPADAIVTWAGLEWVWASPCSGGCSVPLPTYQPGWRYATVAEMANKPSFLLFLNGTFPGAAHCAYPTCKCAAQWFDPVFPFCDPQNAANGLITSEPNGSFWESWYVHDLAPLDSDGDGIPDATDNCPTTPNPDQADADGDGKGDACDACPNDAANDVDQDGVCGNVDNCPAVANTNQLNADGDSKGDACDACPNDAANDADQDGVCGNVDNCPAVANTDQLNSDGDANGNACDVCPLDAANDADHDGFCADVDLCAGTVIPEGVPLRRLLPNHFALVDGDNLFDTVNMVGGPMSHTAPGGGPYTLTDTKGCSCQQIVVALGIGPGPGRFGCGVEIMNTWVSTH